MPDRIDVWRKTAMNWKIFLILLAAGVLIYLLWMFFSQRQVAVLSMMLYRNNDADGYLQELESWKSRLFFNSRLRDMMRIDAYLAKGDQEKITALFQKVDQFRLATGDRLIVLQKEIAYATSQHDEEKARDAYHRMSELRSQVSEKKIANYESMLKECTYLIAIHFDHSGKYADELMQKAKAVKDGIPAGVYYYKAAQSYWLAKDQKKCRDALEKAEVRLRGTAYHKAIQDLLGQDDLSGIMNETF